MNVELQQCEHCSNEYPVETMQMMSDCWFCYRCTSDFRKTFDACEHKWSPHVDEMGDPGRYCERCSGFVRDIDFHRIVRPMQGMATRPLAASPQGFDKTRGGAS